MKFNDLHEVEAWKAGGPPPPGSYTARIDNAEEGTSSGGYDQLEISWTVIGGDYDGAELRDWLVITEKTRGKVVALLKAAGIEIPAGDFELKVSDLVGRTAGIVVIREPRRDDPSKMRTTVTGYKEASEHASTGNGVRNTSGDHEAPLPF